MFYYLITLITLKGNRLHYVLDDAENLTYEGAVEFQGDEANGSAFGYNANGNLITDTGKGIMHIDYDDNNYPKRIQFANGNVTEYIYTATGEKLRAVHYTAVPNIEVGSGETHTLTDAEILFKDSTDYHGSLIMENGVPAQYLFDGGYCKLTDGSGNANISYHYYDRDHLGNIRGVIDESGTVEQITNYYPFGAPYSDATTTNPTFQRYKYNGKELELMHGLKWYDYGARWYDPLLVNWNRPDPSHKDYYPWSPYVYCGDNPINAVDPDGRKMVISGNRQQRIEVLSYLQLLTNDKLGVKQNGDVIIMSTKSKNKGKDLVVGTSLISSIISNKMTATISLENDNSSHDIFRLDASNGKGTNVNISFNPSQDVYVLKRDERTGKIIIERIPSEIVLGHEMIHGYRSMNGEALSEDSITLYRYKGADGYLYEKQEKTEELETVGIIGDYKYTENKLNK